MAYTITTSISGNGTITPAGTIEYEMGEEPLYTFTPDANWLIHSVKIDGEEQGQPGTYQFTPLVDNHSIEVVFRKQVPTISFTGVNNGYVIVTYEDDQGAIDTVDVLADGDVQYPYGYIIELEFVADAGYYIKQIVDNGVTQTRSIYYDIGQIDDDHSIQLNFATQDYTITITQPANGSILPHGTVGVGSGENQIFQIFPNEGYVVSSVIVDGATIPYTNTTYIVEDITSNITFSATFSPRTYSVNAVWDNPLSGFYFLPGANNTVGAGAELYLQFVTNNTYVVNKLIIDEGTANEIILDNQVFSGYSFFNVQTNHTLKAFATPGIGIVVTTSDGGTVSPGTSNYAVGTVVTETVTANNGFIINTIVLDGNQIVFDNPNTFSFNITISSVHKLNVTFRKNEGAQQRQFKETDTDKWREKYGRGKNDLIFNTNTKLPMTFLPFSGLQGTKPLAPSGFLDGPVIIHQIGKSFSSQEVNWEFNWIKNGQMKYALTRDYISPSGDPYGAQIIAPVYAKNITVNSVVSCEPYSQGLGGWAAIFCTKLIVNGAISAGGASGNSNIPENPRWKDNDTCFVQGEGISSGPGGGFMGGGADAVTDCENRAVVPEGMGVEDPGYSGGAGTNGAVTGMNSGGSGGGHCTPGVVRTSFAASGSQAVGTNDLKRIHFGGGGSGSGGDWQAGVYGTGGNGGGIVCLVCEKIEINGMINVAGGNGAGGSRSGGAGAGGSILIMTSKLSATDSNFIYSGGYAPNGGNGGGGRIAIYTGKDFEGVLPGACKYEEKNPIYNVGRGGWILNAMIPGGFQ